MEGKHEHFGLAIKNARIDCGLTQETLAEMAGISCRYLIAIENEGRIPKLPTGLLTSIRQPGISSIPSIKERLCRLALDTPHPSISTG